MSLSEDEEPEVRLELTLEAGGPIELLSLSSSFRGLANLYGRHVGIDEDFAPRLFITKIESGSIFAELAPYVPVLGQAYQAMSYSVTVANFTKRLGDGIRGFAGMSIADGASTVVAANEDAADLKAFLKPLTGRSGASLRVRAARFHKRDGDREVHVEYEFDDSAINRAAVNMDQAMELIANDSQPARSHKFHRRVTMFFEAASRSPGRERGRTRDYSIIPEVSERPLPTYFRESVRGDLKDILVRGETNPLRDVAYIVDVIAQSIDGEPRSYLVTDVHGGVPLDQSVG